MKERRTIWQCFEETALRFPDYECLHIDGDGVYTYEQVRRESLLMARGLYRMGVRPGTHVALQMDNCLEYILASLALARLCAVKIPVNTSLGHCEYSFVVTQSDAEYLITDRVQNHSSRDTKLKKIIVLGKGFVYTNIPVYPDLFLGLTSEAYVQHFSNLDTFVKESGIKFITGEVDIDAGWDNYVSTYLSMGGEELRTSLLDQYNALHGTSLTFE